MHRTPAILVLVIVAALTVSGTSAQALNCTNLATPPIDFYNEPAGCNDTALNSCDTAFTTCKASASTCVQGAACLKTKLRCYEAAEVTDPSCQVWDAAFNNARLFIAAGGDYASSALYESCQSALCQLDADLTSAICLQSDVADVCLANLTLTQAPPDTNSPVIFGPANSIYAEFTVDADVAEAKLAADTGNGGKLVAIFGRIFAIILSSPIETLEIGGYNPRGNLGLATRCLVRNSLTAAQLETSMAAAVRERPVAAFTEIEAFFNVTNVSIAFYQITEATPAPLTGGATGLSVTIMALYWVALVSLLVPCW